MCLRNVLSGTYRRVRGVAAEETSAADAQIRIRSNWVLAAWTSSSTEKWYRTPELVSMIVPIAILVWRRLRTAKTFEPASRMTSTFSARTILIIGQFFSVFRASVMLPTEDRACWTSTVPFALPLCLIAFGRLAAEHFVACETVLPSGCRVARYFDFVIMTFPFAEWRRSAPFASW